MPTSWSVEYPSKSNSCQTTFLYHFGCAQSRLPQQFETFKMKIDIEPVDQTLSAQIWMKIDTKTKPPGSLGQLEKIAAKVALIQGTLKPVLTQP